MATSFQQWQLERRTAVIVIGGPDGLDDELPSSCRADRVVSWANHFATPVGQSNTRRATVSRLVY